MWLRRRLHAAIVREYLDAEGEASEQTVLPFYTVFYHFTQILQTPVHFYRFTRKAGQLLVLPCLHDKGFG